MKLGDAERRMLDGAEGNARRKAMEILAALGEMYGAEETVPVRSAQIAGVSYANLGDAGLELIEEWAADGRVACLATLNPAGMDLRDWRAHGIPEEFAERQARIVAAYERMGVVASCTCTPYLAGNLPAPGEHVAWSESSAVTFANAVLGARTKREGGPSALAAALTGVTPMYGLHLDGPRAPTVTIRVETPIASTAEFGALGAAVAAAAPGRVPLIEGLRDLRVEGLKALAAALPTFGGPPIFHVAGRTPEADRYPRPAGGVAIGRREIDEAAAALDDGAGEVDLVCIGCPHATLDEIRRVAALLGGRRVAAALWIATSRPVRETAARAGLVEAIERSGGTVVADTCFVVAPLEGRFRSVVTDSAKGCWYARGPNRMLVHLRDVEGCVEAAISRRSAVGAQRTAHGAQRTAHGAQRTAHGAQHTAHSAQRTAHSGRMRGRVIRAGSARGIALSSAVPVSFYGGVDPATGVVLEKGHPLEGRSMAGRVLAIPTGKGSTVGSFVLYRMARLGTAPAALVCGECDPVVAVGAILAEIPCVDGIDTGLIPDGAVVRVDSAEVVVDEGRNGTEKSSQP